MTFLLLELQRGSRQLRACCGGWGYRRGALGGATRRHGAQQHPCVTHPLPDMPGAKLQALQHAMDAGLAGQKLRLLCVANADRCLHLRAVCEWQHYFFGSMAAGGQLYYFSVGTRLPRLNISL